MRQPESAGPETRPPINQLQRPTDFPRNRRKSATEIKAEDFSVLDQLLTLATHALKIRVSLVRFRPWAPLLQ